VKALLNDYEQKRNKAILDLELRKQTLYSSCKRLEEIENELNKLSISNAKAILLGGISEHSKINALKTERTKLLNTLDKDDSYLKPIFECVSCEDTGYVDGIMCHCLKQELLNIKYNKSNINKLDKENFNTFDETLYSDEITDGNSPRQNILNIKNICLNFIENFDDENEKSLLFTGHSGLGKTFLSNAIANELLKKEYNVLYQTSSTLFDTIINYRFGKGNVSTDTYDSILNVHLLIIDDLGTESLNQTVLSEIFNVINSRILANKKTIISTNLSLNDLYKTYEERILSRIVGYYTICKFIGDDIRFKKR